MIVKKFILVFTVLLGSIPLLSQEESAAAIDGEEIFRTVCKACHTVSMRMVGPPLAGVTAKYDEEYLLQYIKSSQTVIKSGEPRAVAIFNEYNQILMPDQALSDDQIRSVLAYIDAEAQAAIEAKGTITRPVEEYDKYLTPMNFGDFVFWLPYTLTVLVIIGVLYWLIEIGSNLESS